MGEQNVLAFLLDCWNIATKCDVISKDEENVIDKTQNMEHSETSWNTYKKIKNKDKEKHKIKQKMKSKKKNK